MVMKKNCNILLVTLMMVMSLPATGQVRLGVRGGVTLGKLRFDREVIDSDNRMGYCGGLVLDLAIPVTGIGIEASVMYTHRDNRLSDGDRLFKRHYIDIPLMARYRLALPGVERYVAPLVFTGPAFSILFNENASDNWEGRKTYLSWDAGIGADVMRHLRITASYGIGISKAMSYVDREYEGEKVYGRDKHWTLALACFF